MITSIFPTKEHPDYGTFVESIYKIYLDLGYEVELVAFMREGSKRQKWANLMHFFRSILKARKKAAQGAYDAVNVHYPYTGALPLWLFPMPQTVPLITHVHGTDVFYNSLSKKLMAPATAALLKRSDRIFAPSDFFKKKVAEKFRLPLDRIVSCPPGGFDPEIFHPKGNRLPALSPARHWIGFAGRLVEGKGWRVLLEAYAFALSDASLANTSLALVGSGPDEKAVVQTIRRLGLEDRVVFLGVMRHEEMGDYFRSLDLFCFPTLLEESLGMVGMEALASGTPVVGSAIGGVKEYMKDGINGYAVAPGGVAELQAALQRFYHLSPEKRRDMEQKAHQSVAAYEASAVAQTLAQTFEKGGAPNAKLPLN